MTALWMVPMFTQWFKHYPYLGSLALPTVGLGVVLAGGSLGVYFTASRGEKTSRKSTITNAVLLLVLSGVGASLWAPILNAVLDFGERDVVEGEIYVIENPGKNNPSRRVTAHIDGEDRSGKFHPHAGFWDVPVVRNGGAAQLTVGSGFFGVPWVSQFEDAPSSSK
jgi:hypothetical protein